MRFVRAVVAFATGALLAITPARAVGFAFSMLSGDTLTTDQAMAFQTAANAWSSYLSDPITVNVQIGFRSLGGTTLGATSTTRGSVSANVVKAFLTSDAKDADDQTAVASLPTYSAATSLSLTSAQARAIGFTTPEVTYDGQIEFSSDYSFSTSRNADGTITAGTYDLIGIAEHEIGHLLGFLSSVDGGGSQTILDQFRYAGAGTRSATAGASAYFSIDGGVTDAASFSQGGSGNYQASHWLQGTTSNGMSALMDPALASGRRQDITILDLQALDVIGYDRISAVPEPAGWTLMIVGFGVTGTTLRRGRRPSRRSPLFHCH